jgi:hypothetical protein
MVVRVDGHIFHPVVSYLVCWLPIRLRRIPGLLVFRRLYSYFVGDIFISQDRSVEANVLSPISVSPALGAWTSSYRFGCEVLRIVQNLKSIRSCVSGAWFLVLYKVRSSITVYLLINHFFSLIPKIRRSRAMGEHSAAVSKNIWTRCHEPRECGACCQKV